MSSPALFILRVILTMMSLALSTLARGRSKRQPVISVPAPIPSPPVPAPPGPARFVTVPLAPVPALDEYKVIDHPPSITVSPPTPQGTARACPPTPPPRPRPKAYLHPPPQPELLAPPSAFRVRRSRRSRESAAGGSSPLATKEPCVPLAPLDVTRPTVKAEKREVAQGAKHSKALEAKSGSEERRERARARAARTKAELEELKAAHAALETKHAALKEQHTVLRAEYHCLGAELYGVQVEYTALEDKYACLHHGHGQLRVAASADMARVKGMYETLLATAREEHEAEVAHLRAQLKQGKVKKRRSEEWPGANWWAECKREMGLA